MDSVLATIVVGVAGVFSAIQDPAPIFLEMKDGRSASAQVLGLADGKAKLKVHALEGEITMTRPLDDFVPESAFMIEVRATNPKTFEQHFALAKRAAELDLLPQAGNQVRSAAKLASTGPDGEKKTKELASWAAGELERFINAAVAAGDLKQADHCLGLLTTRLPEERTEEQLAALAASVDTLRTQAAEKKSAERAEKLTKDQQAALEKSFEPIRSKSAKGDKELSKAIAQSKNTAASAKACENAVAAYKDAFEQAQQLSKKVEDDAAAQQELTTLVDHMVDSALRAAFHAANVLVLQSDYKAATDWVNRILKFQPDNEEAKEMLKTIQLASAAGADRDDHRYGGWRRGGGRR